MKEGDFIYLNYTGRVKETGNVFDTTIEETAKSSNVYNPQARYRPLPVIVGANFVFKSLEEEIKKIGVGEKKHVELSPEQAFGQRSTELVRIFSLSDFRNSNVDPAVGSMINANGLNGKITSVSGGRVTIDFNHPLAGKELSYDLEIKEEVKEDEKKVKAIVTYFTGADGNSTGVKIDKKEAEIVFDSKLEISNNIKSSIADAIKKWMKEVEKVKFASIY